MSPSTLVADPAVEYGEIDVDSTEGFGSVGPGHAAKQLILQHAAQHPPELMALKAAPRIDEASEALDLEEVQRVAKPQGEVAGASVKGDAARDPDSWAVTYIFIRESGRSSPGALAYKRLPRSRQEYETRRAALLRGERLTAEGRGTPEEAEQSPREKALAEEVERLREQLEGAQDPEPFSGYADANANDLKKSVKSLEATPENVVAAEQIADYENRHKGRDSVVKAADDRAAAIREELAAAEQPAPS